MTKLPFIGKGEHANGHLNLMHMDVCGPTSIHARCGFIYAITFINDHSRYGYLYLIRYKSKSFQQFIGFKYEEKKKAWKKYQIT